MLCLCQPMATTAELLEKVNMAIANRLDGRAVDEYSVHGVSLKRTPLSELMTLRDKLQAELNAQNRGGVSFADVSNEVL